MKINFILFIVLFTNSFIYSAKTKLVQVKRLSYQPKLLLKNEQCLQTSDDQSLIATRLNNIYNVVTIKKLSSDHVLCTLSHTNTINSIAFSLDNKFVVTASNDHSAKIWDIATGKNIAILQHDAAVLTCKISNDLRFVITGSKDRTARIWDTHTGRLLHKLFQEYWVDNIEIANNNQFFLIISERYIKIYDIQNGQELNIISHPKRILTATISNDSNYIATGSKDELVVLWDSKTFKPIRTISCTNPTGEIIHINKVIISDDNNFIIIAYDNIISVWNFDGELLYNIEHIDKISNIILSETSEGNKFIFTSTFFSKVIYIYNLQTGEKILEIKNEQIMPNLFVSPKTHKLILVNTINLQVNPNIYIISIK